jgi:hypothetical protein
MSLPVDTTTRGKVVAEKLVHTSPLVQSFPPPPIGRKTAFGVERRAWTHGPAVRGRGAGLPHRGSSRGVRYHLDDAGASSLSFSRSRSDVLACFNGEKSRAQGLQDLQPAGAPARARPSRSRPDLDLRVARVEPGAVARLAVLLQKKPPRGARGRGPSERLFSRPLAAAAPSGSRRLHRITPLRSPSPRAAALPVPAETTPSLAGRHAFGLASP